MPTARRRTAPKSDEDTSRKGRGKASPPAGQDREALLVALGRLKPALRTGGAIPELAHMWFADGHVRAYDGGLGIRLAHDLGLACGVPGRALLGLLGTSSLKEVTLEHDEKDVALVVKMGRSRTKLNVLDPGRDPWRFPTENAGGSRISEEGIEAIRSVLISKASSPTRLEHHGISVYADGADVDVYAYDSKTVAQATYADKEANLPEFVFLPRPLAEQIVALCPHGADLTVADDYFAAVGRGVEIYSNVLDTEGIIQLPSLLNKKIKPHPEAVPLPTGLEAALDRAEVLAGSGGDAVMDLAVKDRQFRLTGKYAFGTLDEKLELETEHPEASLKVEAAMLRRGLLATDAFSATDDSLAFWGGENFLYVVGART